MVQRLAVTKPKNDKMDPHGVNPTLSIFLPTPFNSRKLVKWTENSFISIFHERFLVKSVYQLRGVVVPQDSLR